MKIYVHIIGIFIALFLTACGSNVVTQIIPSGDQQQGDDDSNTEGTCNTPQNPSLSTLSDLCSSSDIDVSVQWQSQDGHSYQVEFYTSDNWVTVDILGQGVATMNSLPTGSNYRFRIRTYEGICQADDWLESNIFAIYAPPQLPDLEPQEDLCGNNLTILLAFTAQQDVNYQAQLWDGTVWHNASITNNQARVDGINEGSSMYWQLSASYMGCQNDSFAYSNTFNIAPGPTNPSLHVSDICSAVASPSVNWTIVDGESYTVEFSSDGNSWYMPDVQNPDNATMNNLSPGSYYWRIKASDQICDTAPFSLFGPFGIAAPPQAPTVLTGNDFCSNTNPLLQFSGHQDATSLSIVVIDPDANTEVYIADAQTDAIFATNQQGKVGSFSWYVQALGASFCPVADSYTDTFAGYPNTITPQSPVASATCSGDTAVLSWSNEQSYGNYYVEIDTGSGYSSSGITNITANAADFTTIDGGSYDWRVRHESGVCMGSSWAIGTVLIEQRPQPSSLALNNLYTPSSGPPPYDETLSWDDTNPVPTNGYEIELYQGACETTLLEDWPKTTFSNSIDTDSLTDQGLYSWRVRPLSHGICPAGDFSPCESFLVMNASVAWFPLGYSDLGSWYDFLECSGACGGISNSANSSTQPVMVLDQTGMPVVVWHEYISSQHYVYLKKWNGSQWVELDDSASGVGLSDITDDASYPSIAIDSTNQIIVAWQNENSALGTNDVYLKRWNGTNWEEIDGSASGSGVHRAEGMYVVPVVAVDSNDIPYVAWEDSSGSSPQIYVSRYSGSSWHGIGGSDTGLGVSQSSGNARFPDMVIDLLDQPVVAWDDNASGTTQVYLKRFNGTIWEEIAGSASGLGISSTTNTAEFADIAIDSNNYPAVAWFDNRYSGGQWQIHFKRYDGSDWISYVNATGRVTNSAYGVLARYPSLIFDSDDNPWIAWEDETEGSFYQIYMYYWNGSAWTELDNSATEGGISNTEGESYRPTLVFDGSSNPVVSWGEGNIMIKRWDGTQWDHFNNNYTSQGISNNLLDSDSPHIDIAMDSTGNPGICWKDRIDDIYKAYYKYYDGTTWLELDASASVDGLNVSTSNAHSCALKFDSHNHPFIAWYEGSGGFEVFMKWHDGDGWQNLDSSTTPGEGLSNTSGSSYMPKLALTPDDRPIITWYENASNSEIFLLEWNGTSWVELDGSYSTAKISESTTNNQYPDIAIDGSGYPVVTWFGTDTNSEIYVKRFNGTSWVNMGTDSNNSGGISNTTGNSKYPSIAYNGDSQFIIAWQDNQNSVYEIYALLWDGSDWISLDGSDSLGGISDTTADSLNPKVAFDSSGNPIVAWEDESNGQTEIYLKRWNGTTWIEVDGSATGGGISNSSGFSISPALAIGGGLICVAWHEEGPDSKATVVRCHLE